MAGCENTAFRSIPEAFTYWFVRSFNEGILRLGIIEEETFYLISFVLNVNYIFYAFSFGLICLDAYSIAASYP